LYPAQRIVTSWSRSHRLATTAPRFRRLPISTSPAGLRGGEDRARPVRRREDQRLVPRLREVAGRGAHVESLDDDRVAFPAEHPFSKLGLQRACLVDLAQQRTRGQPAASAWAIVEVARTTSTTTRRRRLPTRPE